VPYVDIFLTAIETRVISNFPYVVLRVIVVYLTSLCCV